jgi:hypothetical protein
MKFRPRLRDGVIGTGRFLLLRWLPVLVMILTLIARPLDGVIGGS